MHQPLTVCAETRFCTHGGVRRMPLDGTLLRVDEGRSTVVSPRVTCTSLGMWNIVKWVLGIHFVRYQTQVEGI